MRPTSHKWLLFLLLPLIFLLGCRDKSQLVSTDDAVRENPLGTGITIFSPIGGENYVIGQRVLIKWQASKDIRQVNLWLYRKDAYELTIMIGADREGEYSWLIPQGLSPSEHYKIRVSNYQSNQEFSYSQEFKILE